jgi:hypothetical protein
MNRLFFDVNVLRCVDSYGFTDLFQEFLVIHCTVSHENPAY